jgi:hypothetical protein
MREDDGDAAQKEERGRLAGPRTAGVVRVRRGASGRRGGSGGIEMPGGVVGVEEIFVIYT